jgi:O-antigen/teichoic acid export membrane protein
MDDVKAMKPIETLSIARTPARDSAPPVQCTVGNGSHKMIPSRAITDELRKLFRQSGHYLTGLVTSLVLGFVSFPIFTRMFSVSDYGTIDLVAKILLLLAALSKMGLQQSALRFYDGRLFSNDKVAARRYYSTMFCGVALAAASVTLLFLAILRFAPKTLMARSLTAILFLVSGLVLVRALSSVLMVFLRVQEKTKLYSVLLAVSKAATVAGVCLFVPLLGRSVRAYYSGTIVVEMAVALMLSVTLIRDGLVDPHGFDMALFRTGLAFGLPLIFYELSTIILDAGDRILVRHYLGANALGYYSVAYGMSDYVNSLLITPLNLALTPIYIRLWTSNGQESTSEFLSRGLDFFLMAAAGILAVVTATSRYAVVLLASSKYRAAGALIPTLVAGLLIYTSHAFLSAGLMIHKDTFTMAKLVAYSALLNIGLNCLLLPRMGLQAAALATLLSYLFCILLLGRASYRLLPLKIDLRAAGKYAFGAVAAWYAASHVELGWPIANLGARCVLTLTIYCGLLYLMDSRIRAIPGYLFARHRRQGHAVSSLS